MISKLARPFTLFTLIPIVSKVVCALVYLFIGRILKLSLKMEHDVNQQITKKKMFSIKILQFERIKIESQEPSARSGHRMVCDSDGNLYVLGGYNSDLIDDYELKDDDDWVRTRPLFAELWKFNISTNRFTKLRTTGEFPQQLASHSCEMLNDDTLISFGGTAVPFEEFSSNNLYMCDLKTKHWTLLNPMCKEESQFPTKKYGQALCLDEENSKIYTCGGTDGFSFCADLHCYDFREKLWTQLTLPTDKSVESRYRHEMTLYENSLFIFGGGNGTNTELTLETLPYFDLKNRRWELCETIGHTVKNSMSHTVKFKFPSPRRCHIICRYKDFVFLLGGLSKLRICRDLWKFDLRIKKWTLLIEQIPISIYFHGASVSSFGQLTFFGGITTGQKLINVRSKRLYSVYIDIPPLAIMAWKALLYYNDNFKNKTDDQLLKLGLPNIYVKKLRD